MTNSLELWKVSTGTNKIDFAERSGIWHANFDRSSMQARTLDKYLLIETLPANPRWRDVLRSAEFSLAQVAKQPSDDEEINHRADELRHQLTQLRMLLREGRGLA